MKHIFLCGVPRGGTTALTFIFNLHPKIVMGVERYKFLISGTQIDSFGPDLFEEDRFFDIRDTDTNVKAERAYLRMRGKFADAEYFGDKIPRLYAQLPALYEAFPDAKVVFITRDPVAVASSWEARASNDADSWPKQNGYAAGVAEWNKANAVALDAVERYGSSFLPVFYHDIFPNGKTAIEKLFDILEVPKTRSFKKLADSFLEKERPFPNRAVNDVIVQYVRANADFETYEKLKAASPALV